MDGNPFLLTISWHLSFITVSHLENRNIETVIKHFLDVYKMYKYQGFTSDLLHVDGEFAALQALLHTMDHGPRINLTSANEMSLKSNAESVWPRRGLEHHVMPCHLPAYPRPSLSLSWWTVWRSLIIFLPMEGCQPVPGFWWQEWSWTARNTSRYIFATTARCMRRNT